MTIEAWLLLWMCRAWLWFAPFPRVLRWTQWAAAHARSRRVLGPDEAVRRIQRALPYTWHCSCLTQALAGWILLTRHGATARVKIGVATPGEQRLAAHAWLEAENRVILGDADPATGLGLEPFHVIWTLPPET